MNKETTRSCLNRILATVMTLAMVLGMLPTGLLSFSAAATGTAVTEKTIYVDGTNGSDSNDGLTAANAFKTIQAAVNAVDENNTTPTTILIAGGAYNVHVEQDSPNDAITSDSYGHNLVISKSNLTLKAKDGEKVVIYGYSTSETALNSTSVFKEGYVLNIRNSENLTIDGLVILPHFVTTTPGVTKTSTTESAVNNLVEDYLSGGLFDTTDDATLYFATGRSMICMDSSVPALTNGSVNYVSGLTFKNCHMITVGTQAAIHLYSTTTGDYHFINNTLTGNLEIEGAGSGATNNEIIGNTFVTSTNSLKKIKISGAIAADNLPVIEGNTFKATDNNIPGVTSYPNQALAIENASTSGKYSKGELAVMCLSNTLEQATPSAANKYLVYDESAQTVSVGASEDTTIDTEEELAYWLTQEGEYTLAADITLTKALPEYMPGILTLGTYTDDDGKTTLTYKITKPASLISHAPKGYCWLNGKTLNAQKHIMGYLPEVSNGVTTRHYSACISCKTPEEGPIVYAECTPRSTEGKYDCTAAIHCTVCAGITTAAKSGHNLSAVYYDNNLYHAYKCQDCDQTVRKLHETASGENAATCASSAVCDVCGEAYGGTDAAVHTFDNDCTTDDECQDSCGAMAGSMTAHSFDTNCTTDDVCQNDGCAVTAGKASFHTFDGNSDTACNVDGCTYTREAIEGSIIYVDGANGNDSNNGLTAAAALKTIQAAVNAVPAANTTPTTILIADGIYNVYVEAKSDLDVITGDSYGHNLIISKSNLTLKAQNKQKVLLYGYNEGSAGSAHSDGSVIHILKSENVTLDGLIVLPAFVQNNTGLSASYHTVDTTTVNTLVSTLLYADSENTDGINVFAKSDGTAPASVSYFITTGRPLVRTGEYAVSTTKANGPTTNSGLTFQNCYFHTVGSGYQAFYLDLGNSNGGTAGDYHFIGNTIVGVLAINGAGSEATVTNRIVDNELYRGIIIEGYDDSQITGKLPTISGNIFYGAACNAYNLYDYEPYGDAKEVPDCKVSALIWNPDEKDYALSETDLSIIAKTNYDANGRYLAYRVGKQSTGRQYGIEAKKVYAAVLFATDDYSYVDSIIDTQEELLYALTQEGVVILGGDIALTEALPETMPATLVLNGYSLTKASTLTCSVPNGCCDWKDDTTLVAHSFDTDCTTDDICSGCGTAAGSMTAHSYDTDCTTADTCQNEGCTVATTANDSHTFEAHKDTCSNSGCTGVLEIETDEEAETEEEEAETEGKISEDDKYKEASADELSAIQHEISEEWLHDGVSHWRVCTVDGCTLKFEEAYHIPAPDDGNCTTAIYCRVCKELMEEGNASHRVDKNCTAQTNCTIPGCYVNVEARTEHSFSSDAEDAACTIPGCTVTCNPAHTASEEWYSDHLTHWRACTDEGCDERLDESAHVLSLNGRSCSGAIVCTVCEREIMPALAHSYTDYTTIDATCTANSTMTASCEDCKAVDIIELPGTKLGHSFTDYVISGNTMTASCTACGETDTVALAEFDDAQAGLYQSGLLVNEWDALVSAGRITLDGTVITGCDPSLEGVLVIADGVTGIADEAFADCTGLTGITVAESVTYIGIYAFGNCDSLTSITVPAAVTEIGTGAFNACDTLTQILVESGNTSYCSVGGVLFSADRTTLLACPAGKGGSYEIPEGVTAIGDYAFVNCDKLTAVEVPAGVTEIGVHAFDGCDGLTAVTLLDSVSVIGDYAFASCGSLTGVVIPEGVAAIGSSAFENSGLTEISIPGSEAVIGDYAFANCDALTAVTVQDGVAEIGSYAFLDCDALTEISVAASVTNIDAGAFYSCNALVRILVDEENTSYCSVDGVLFSEDMQTLVAYPAGKTNTVYMIPTGVTAVGSYAFADCDTLTGVGVPTGLTDIGAYAFFDCSGLEQIVCIGTQTAWEAITKGDNWDTNTGVYTVTYEHATHTEVEDAAVAPTCTATGLTAGTHCSVCGTVLTAQSVIPATGHTEVVDAAVDATCTTTGLTEGKHCSVCNEVLVAQTLVAITGHTEVVDAAVAATCTTTGLTEGKHCSVCNEVLVAQTVVAITDHCYVNGVCCVCGASLSSVGLEFALNATADGYTVTGIGTCTDTVLVIPDTYNGKPVTAIGVQAFLGCTGLTGVTIPDSVTVIGNHAFSGCTGLTDVTIGSGVTEIGNYAFRNCFSLTAIVLPDSVTNIGKAAFHRCSGLTAVTLGDKVTAIGDYAFYDCSGLAEITIPASVASIGKWAFKGCSGLTQVNIPNGVTSIGEYTFYGCSGLTEITIPDSVAVIGNSAFHYCTGLTAVTVGSGVTEIGNWAFKGCTGLTEITIPAGVTSIGKWAFYNCSGLTDITFAGTAEQWSAISLGEYWKRWTPATKIACSDEDVTL